MTLRHSLFDKIFISFLVIFTVCFGFIVLYASNVTRSMLVDDRTEVLTNEAFLIADQTVAGYVQGVYTKDELQESLRYYSDKLNASIWVTNEKGIIYGFANADGHPDNPKNIFSLTRILISTPRSLLMANFTIRSKATLFLLPFQSILTTSQTVCY